MVGGVKTDGKGNFRLPYLFTMIDLKGSRIGELVYGGDEATLGETGGQVDRGALNATIHRNHQVGMTRRNIARLFCDNRFGRDAAQADAAIIAAFKPHFDVSRMCEKLAHDAQNSGVQHKWR